MAENKILVVDDENDLLELISKTLSIEGYEVVTSGTAEDAIDKAKRIAPDLILMDIMLPDMEGPEAVRILDQNPVTGSIPVIFLSGIVTREREGDATTEVLVGEKSYKAISKPFTAQELLTEVRQAIG